MSKKRDDAGKKFDGEASFAPIKALGLVKSSATAKFDETVEATFNLGIDPKQADQGVRGTVALPHGTGKKVKVLVFAEGEAARAAEAAASRCGTLTGRAARMPGVWLEEAAMKATGIQASGTRKRRRSGVSPRPSVTASVIPP